MENPNFNMAKETSVLDWTPGNNCKTRKLKKWKTRKLIN